MKLTKQNLKDQCEQIQEDISCILDGCDEQMLDDICQVIVDRFRILKKKFLE